MAVRSVRGFLGMAAMVLLMACASGRGDSVRSSSGALDSGASGASGADAGALTCEPGCGKNESCVEGRCICQPATCSSLGVRCGTADDGCGGLVQCGECRPPCAEDEMECCGACIPKSERRCPENVHCREPAPLQ